MKSKYKISGAVLGAFILLGTGCAKKLVEHPYTVFSVDYFKTTAGIQAGINTLYSGMRYNYGPNGAMGITNVGTDEWTYGDQPRTGADNDVLYLGQYSSTFDYTNGALQTPWNYNYSNINLANGLITFAPTVALDSASKTVILAEAHYMRAQYYMLLVQQFGAVPTDLGSGELKFNQNAYQGFNRLPMVPLLVKDYQAIIDDLTFASQNLPNTRPTNAFKLSKAAAFHLLAKAYIYRAYSTAKQPTDFASAYTAAMQVINNQGLYGVGLLQDYGDIHKVSNDYNKEILYSVERIPGDPNDNEVPNPGSDFSGKTNISNNMFIADYTSINVPAASNYKPCGSGALNTTPGLPWGVVGTNGRTGLYGRPLRRYCPTKWLLETAFADRFNDSRFDNTFRMMFVASPGNTLPSPATGGAALINGGDTAFLLAQTDHIADSMNAIPKKYRVIAPREFYSNQNTAQNIYPTIKKFDDPFRATPNDISGRPFVVSKLSEVYLLAAEAAMGDGKPNDAVPLLNILRERAAYRPGLSGTDLINRKAAMDVTAGQINLDFILDERTRELCGESTRWPDLAVRHKLVERVKLYNPDAGPNIKSTHELRPIPKNELDAISDPNKAQYQNPGY
jgi:hypothetical protein